MDNKLRIAIWNANGLSQHIPELEIFLKNENIDICLVSETHLTKDSHITIFNYACYHSPHPSNRARGGSAVLIKNNIQHYEEFKMESETMQVTTISIQAKHKVFKVAGIYCPPRSSPTGEDYTNLFQTLGNNFIIGGDLNAKHTYWGSRITNKKGKILYCAGQSYKCQFFSSGAPTYWPSDPTKVPDLIDFFVVKGISGNHIIIESNDDLSSDHSPVILTLSETIMQKENLPRLTNRRTNWDKFREKLELSIDLGSPLETTGQVDAEVEQFVADVQQAAEESTPTMQGRTQAKINYPEEIRKLVLDKRKARRKWHLSRYPGDKTILNRLSNQLKKRISEFKNESISRFLCNLTADKYTDYSLWKAAKRLKRPQILDPPLKTHDGKWVGNPKAKADLFAEHLANVFKSHPQETAVENITLVDKVDNMEIPFITLKELKNFCKHNLSNKKAPGYDLITGQVMKELPDIAFLKLQHIINASFKLKHVPRHWKIAEVIVIVKPGKPPTEVASYRPISLLPVMSKIFEKMLLKRLCRIIEDRKLIPSHQFGFRNKHSTIDQVHRITNVVEKALEEKKVCSAIFLDVAQAFDKVWHEGLNYKLHRDLPRQYFEILKSYIADRFFRVRYGKEYSELKEISAGVPQGSVLGPILYLLYTRDIPVNENSVMATFADDTAILAVDKGVETATMKLQHAVNRVRDWTQRWRIKLNETKSIQVNFTYKKIVTLPIYINNQIVPHANVAKYLGMNLDAKLKWKEHIKKKKEELNLKYRKLYWLLGRNSELSVENKIKIYKQVLRPVWTYGIQIWGCAMKTNVQMIQTFQNKVLRGIVNAPWYVRNNDLHRDLRIELVSEVIKKYAVKHDQRLQTHVNYEMNTVVNVNNNIRRLKRTKPYELMV